MTPPVVLTIAGSDPIGGAGLQADLRTFAALGVHGASALTAVTAQTTVEVRAFWPVEPAQLVAQLEGILEDLPVVAVKTGLVPTSELLEVVVGFAEANRLPNLVVDPVIVNRTGQPFVHADTIAAYEQLLAHAVLTTPNHNEAKLIGDAAALTIVTNAGTDTLSDGRVLTVDRIDTNNTRGTGDTLSAAITAYLGHGDDLDVAIAKAKAWVTQSIANAVEWKIGQGPGPIDQMHWEGADLAK